MEEKTISLKQNAFLAFIYQTATIIIAGAGISYVLGIIKCPNILRYIIFILSYIISFGFGFWAIRKNCRTLSFNGNSISVLLKKLKGIELIQQIKYEDVDKVEEDGDNFVFTLKNENIEVIPLSYYLAPSNKLKMEIRAVLHGIFKEKAESLINEDLNSFINTNTLPKNLKDEDVSENFKRVYSAIGSILAIGLGTLLFCYEALLIFVKGSLMLLGS